MEYTSKKFLSSFGRNRGRALRPYQQQLVDELLPTLAVNLSEIQQLAANGGVGSVAPPLRGSQDALGRLDGGTLLSHASKSEFESRLPPTESQEGFDSPSGGELQSPASPLQPHFTSIALEIGFGGGEHLLAQASHNRDTLFIGCEPFINGVAKCLAGIAEQKLTNIRLFTNDARQLIEQLPVASVDSVFILFPDPWPKLRHNKRRLVGAHTLSMLARIHKAGGRLLIATDHVDYSAWILETLLNNTDYTWTAAEKADWQTPPSDWTKTKYQQKTTEQGREPMFFECARR